MKACLYLEMENQLKASGISSAIKNQRSALDLNNVEHTSDLSDDFDILHLNLIGLKSLHLARRMRRKGRKIVVHAHVTADDFRNSYRFSNVIAPFLRRYLAYYYNQADLVLCPSEYTKNVLLRYGIKKPIVPISNGIDLNKFQFSEEKREKFRNEYSLDSITPLCVGHLFIRKGIKTYVNVAREFSNRFIWVGRRYVRLEEPEVSWIVKDAPSNVTFINFIEDIVSAYCGTDVFFFPSFCENQGIVILEAAACRRPIIVRDIPVYENWLTDGVDCLKARTDEEFKQKLGMLFEDESLRKKLADNAHEMVKEHSLQQVGAKLKGIYEDLLSA
ncbi:MAG: glycosyltransferase family 4 protein [Candidatus Altiarchaeota archaeon]|nr:glycosyltransferase family 4 protein [Candidatus Altiarchaeota archaeon]